MSCFFPMKYTYHENEKMYIHKDHSSKVKKFSLKYKKKKWFYMKIIKIIFDIY